jgi:hypothetical protein
MYYALLQATGLFFLFGHFDLLQLIQIYHMTVRIGANDGKALISPNQPSAASWFG